MYLLPRITMSPEEIMAIFSPVAATFSPIKVQPTDDDLTALCEVLHPLLLGIPYNEDGTHNLSSLVEPPAAYAATWGTLFPIPP